MQIFSISELSYKKKHIFVLSSQSQTHFSVSVCLVRVIAADMTCKHFMESFEQQEMLYIKIKALT